MFAVIQFPLIDVRPFLDADTGRVTSPAWPIVFLPDEPYKAPFVRGFGRALKRQRGGVAEWPAEDAYCDVSNALRFRQAVLKGDATAGRLRRYCAFRRLFWDGQFKNMGSVIGRVEIGFGVQFGDGASPFSAAQLGELLDGLLAQQVVVTAPSSVKRDGSPMKAASMPLSHAGSALAKAYLRASTRGDARGLLEGHDWWLQASTPLTIVEFTREAEVEALPRNTVSVPLSAAAFGKLRVFLGHRTLEGRERPVWFLETARGFDRDALRRLRINITRLHAALSGLRALSDLQLKQRLAPTSEAAKRNLQDCLAAYLPFLYQQEYQGFPWTDFLRAAMTLSEALTPNELTTLRALHPAPGRGLRAQLDLASKAVAATQPRDAEPLLWDVFLAHASPDKPIARRLYDLLGAQVRVFLDEKSVPLGADYDVTIRDAQRRSYMTVVLVGDTADAAYYLRAEVQTAISLARIDDQRHRVVPLYLQGSAGREAAQLYGLNLKQGIDLTTLDDLPAAAERILNEVTQAKPTA